MNNEKIRIYTKVKSDMEFVIKQIENHSVDIIKIYLSGITKEIEKEQEKENNNGKKANK